MDHRELEKRLLALECKCTRLLALVVFVTGMALVLPLSVARSAKASSAPDVLRVRELVVVDENGVERVIIGAPLPGQWQDGKVNTTRVPRPFRQAGILLFDKDGVERGGYVTEDTGDNALLTLDDKHKQEVLLVTGPVPTSSFRMWIGSDSLELRVDPELNGPTLRMIRNGKILVEQPQRSGANAR